MTTPKYRTDARACSCLGFWYRRSCRHIIAYSEAVALVAAQDAVNLAGIRPRVVTGLYGPLEENGMGSANLHPVTVKTFAEVAGMSERSAFMLFGGLTCLAMGTCCSWPRAS